MIRRRNESHVNQPNYWGNSSQDYPYFYADHPDFYRQNPFNQPQMNPYWNSMYGSWNSPHAPYAQISYNPAMQSSMYLNQNGMNQPKNNYSKMLFQNPLQPDDDPIYGYYNQQQGYQSYNPYPQQAFIPKHPTGMQSIMNSFKSQDGHFDFNKMVDTAGQMVNAVSQVSSLVKGLGGVFKV